MNRLIVTIDGHTHQVKVDLSGKETETITATIDGENLEVFVPPEIYPSGKKLGWIVIDGKPIEFNYDPSLHWIMDQHGLHTVELKHRADSENSPGKINGRIKAPVPGRLIDILVKVGQKVECGQPLAILEALDMFNELQAPKAGVIKSIYAQPGGEVSRGETILDID